MRTFKFGSISAILLAMIEVLFFFGFTAMPARAETRVQGTIPVDASWTAENSPYLLEDNVTVPVGTVLTIGPGVTVGVAPEIVAADAGFEPSVNVDGQLSVKGTGKSRVTLNGIGGVFVSGGSADIADADLTGGARLSFVNHAVGTLASSTISGANMGLWFDRSFVSIWGSRIKGNQTGIYVQPDKVFLEYNKKADSRLASGLRSASGLNSIGDLALNFGTNGPYGFRAFQGMGYALKVDQPINGMRSDAASLGNQIADSGQTADTSNATASSSLTIRGSSIAGNTANAINNGATYAVDAVGNWWGSTDGPAVSGANSIRGLVNDAPWLGSEPPLDMNDDPPACCSSILFLPGLEGTRLYRIVPNPISQWIRVATATSQLWEPHGNDDVTALDSKTNGSSTDPSIYSGGPIDKVLGIYGVYGRFMSFMDGLVSNGTVNEWRAFGYDWREPVAGVVAGSEKRATTTESLLQTVADLAAKSKTGKVTIVAHSNGGLVAKDLVKTLSDQGNAGLIDSVISVAVPYLGTPSAIPDVLNGYDQSIAYGLIATAGNMRTMGANMPSAYSLMPSRGFFDYVSDAFKPTIAYASTTADSFEAQSSFIADASNAHQAVPPSSSNLAMPVKGNKTLMNAADIIHGLLDPFVWPAAIARWAIVGWNAETPKETIYSNSGYSVQNTVAGDGTVIAPSADYDDGQTVSLDLKAQSALDDKDISHGNILEASTAVSAIGSIVSHPSANPATNNSAVIDQISKLPGVTIGALDWDHMDDANKELRITTHSPVALNVYDSQGRHTGEIPMPAELVGQVEDGLYAFFEDKIPGSHFDQLGDSGDGHADESVLVPDNGDKYTVVLDGTAAGSFELDVERLRATTVVDTVEWKNIPIDSTAVATTTIVSSDSNGPIASNPSASAGSGDGSNTAIPSLASSTSALSLDIDGDGTIDATSSPNSSVGTDQILQMLEKACGSLDHGGSRGKGLINRLEHARSVWKSWQTKKTAASHPIDFEGIGGQTGHLRFKGMNGSDSSRVFDTIDAFVRQFE